MREIADRNGWSKDRIREALRKEIIAGRWKMVRGVMKANIGGGYTYTPIYAPVRGAD